MADTKDQIINSMCLTWRHDFGLEKRHDAFGYSGMTPGECDALRRLMAQLFEHHIAPLIAENERLCAFAHQVERIVEGDMTVTYRDYINGHYQPGDLREDIEGLRLALAAVSKGGQGHE